MEAVYRIEGLEWGDLDSALAIEFSHHYDRIMAADCLWMPSQHLNLVRTMLQFLTEDPGGRVFVVAGFHTGRAKVASFFEVGQGEGLEIQEIYEEDSEGVRREWTSRRDDGSREFTERKRWLVIATLKRQLSH